MSSYGKAGETDLLATVLLKVVLDDGQTLRLASSKRSERRN